jgi:hypothetical protein
MSLKRKIINLAKLFIVFVHSFLPVIHYQAYIRYPSQADGCWAQTERFAWPPKRETRLRD